MRYLAIGDIHGCYTALRALVDFVDLQSDDVLITLGDYIDRGPNSRAVIDWLIKFPCEGQLVPIRGNHEIMMMWAREDELARPDWLTYGGVATLNSYPPETGAGTATLADVPEHHWEFMADTCQAFYEIDSHFFVHANVHPELPLSQQPDDMLYWQRFGTMSAHESGKIMVCGHTPQVSGIPVSIGHAVCVDTWAYGEGWLSCLDVKTGQYWQANQRGQTREAMLEVQQ